MLYTGACENAVLLTHLITCFPSPRKCTILKFLGHDLFVWAHTIQKLNWTQVGSVSCSWVMGPRHWWWVPHQSLCPRGQGLNQLKSCTSMQVVFTISAAFFTVVLYKLLFDWLSQRTTFIHIYRIKKINNVQLISTQCGVEIVQT